MNSLELVGLPSLMRLTDGKPEVVVGLLDGAVALKHPDLTSRNIRALPKDACGFRANDDSLRCKHGTFVAGILNARRGSSAPAICPGCTLLVRSIFPDVPPSNNARDHWLPHTTPEKLAEVIVEVVNAGVKVVNLSAAIAVPSIREERELKDALDFAMRRGVIVVVASGNQGMVGSTAITRHPAVLPVVAYDQRGVPLGSSNFSGSTGLRGLGAPGDMVTSLGTNGEPVTAGGTSAAAPFVTGAIALLWSVFSRATATDIRLALTRRRTRRTAVVPPLLDAWSSYQMMMSFHGLGVEHETRH